MKNKAVISLAANDENRYATLAATRAALEQIVTIEAATPFYETKAEGTSAQAPYLNAMMKVSTEHTQEELNEIFKRMECEAGRTPESKAQGIIPLDIDILTWNHLDLKPEELNYNYVKEGLTFLLMAQMDGM